jgi:hypothetical protein
MDQKDKELLLKDLCARLPYGVKVQVDLQSNIHPPITCKVCNIEFTEEGSFIGVETSPDTYNEFREFLCKPYLFPFYSMSEEQKREWRALMISDSYGILYPTIKSFDYLYKNHVDIRGLIPIGLAIDATHLNVY